MIGPISTEKVLSFDERTISLPKANFHDINGHSSKLASYGGGHAALIVSVYRNLSYPSEIYNEIEHI